MTPLLALDAAGKPCAFDWMDKVHKTIKKDFMRIVYELAEDNNES